MFFCFQVKKKLVRRKKINRNDNRFFSDFSFSQKDIQQFIRIIMSKLKKENEKVFLPDLPNSCFLFGTNRKIILVFFRFFQAKVDDDDNYKHCIQWIFN